MTTHTMRYAAAQMRRDSVNGQTEDSPFLEAVADWLSEVAQRSETAPKQYRGARHAYRIARAYIDVVDPDPERFCSRCLAGAESSEHFEKCGEQ